MRHKKDAYYFSHDSNAKDDPKCVLLIEQLGLEGYGIFWVLVETLRDQPDFKYPLKLISALARRYNTSTEKIRTVILSYDLFEIEDDTFFFSMSLNKRMNIFLNTRKKLSEAGKRGNEIRWANKIAKQSGGDSLAIASKVKETKVNLFFEEKVDDDFFNDGVNRNWQGLKNNLNSYKCSDSDFKQIAKLSNYGEIGHPIWTLISEIRNSNGKIKHPIQFILSRIKEE